MGQTIEEAQEDAESRLPPEVSEVTPVTYFLYHRSPLRLAAVKQTMRDKK